MIDKITKFLSDPYVNLFITVVSFIIPVIVNKLNKRLLFYKIFKNYDEDNVIGYSKKNKDVAHLIAINLLFWNGGKNTIKKDDIIKPEQFQIKTQKNAPIISSEIVFRTDVDNNISAKINKSDNTKIDLKFDFLEPKDGCIIEIIYEDDNYDGININGKLINKWSIKEYSRMPFKKSIGLYISILLFSWGFGFLGFFIKEHYQFFGLAILIFGFLLYPTFIILYFRKQQSKPEKFRKYKYDPNILKFVMTKSFEQNEGHIMQEIEKAKNSN